MNNNERKAELLGHCDKRFYPYVEKVLMRLPEQVRDKEVLSDTMLKIISFHGKSNYGLFVPFGSSIKWLVVLNAALLVKPEFQIIHTIAHELAHKVAGKGETYLWEMEAEKLLCEWGFEKESKAADYYKPALESGGFEIGYQWARDHDLTEFEAFYDEWNEGRLTSERFIELMYVADITSILDQMGCLEEPETLVPGEISDSPGDKMLVDDGSLGKGIIWGIMCFLRKKKAEATHVMGDPREEDFEFREQLTRVCAEIKKLFDSIGYSKCVDMLPNLGGAYLQICALLDNEAEHPQ